MLFYATFFVIVQIPSSVPEQPINDKQFPVFQPGDFFDPFAEVESQKKPSLVPQPNLIFGEPNTRFSQPFKPPNRPTRFTGYPRAIGLESGNRAQLNAQIWEPSSFFERQQPPVSAALKKLDDVALAEVEKNKKQDVVTAKSDGVSAVAESREVENHAPPSRGSSNFAGQGQDEHSSHHLDRGKTRKNEYKSDHHQSEEDHEKHEDHNKKSHTLEKGGNVESQHVEGSHYKKYHEGKKSHKAAKFGEKKGHKRGHKTKGYHNKFHRDEYHREHRFYDDYNKEGFHEKHGSDHKHYKKNQGGHKKGGSHRSGNSAQKFGEKGSSKTGRHVDDNEGFSREGGKKKFEKHHKEHHRKGAKAKGKRYGYKRRQ